MSQALEAQSAAQVPDLVRTPALADLTAEDIALPRLYIGQYMSAHVQEQRVKAGQIFAATGADDADPIVLWDPEKKGDNPGVLVHVLALRKGKSITDGGELVLFDWNDPAAPEDAWVTYNYTVLVPEHDVDVPHKWLLTRTGSPAAKQINTVLKKNEAKGPAYVNAFRFTTAPRENAKGKFFIPQVRAVEADKANIELAEGLAELISGHQPETQAPAEQPAI